MRTRCSPRNQDRLFRELFKPEEAPARPVKTCCCFNCVNYGGGRRGRNECTLRGEIVMGTTEDRKCYREGKNGD